MHRAQAWKNATFTQYPRCNHTNASAGGLFPGKVGQGTLDPAQYPTDNACTGVESDAFYAMGYSIRSLDFRLTQWVRWDGATLQPKWDELLGEVA